MDSEGEYEEESESEAMSDVEHPEIVVESKVRSKKFGQSAMLVGGNMEICAGLDVFPLELQNPSNSRPSDSNEIDPLDTALERTIEIDTIRNVNGEFRPDTRREDAFQEIKSEYEEENPPRIRLVTQPPDPVPFIDLYGLGELDRLFPFLRKVSEAEFSLSVSVTSGLLLEGEPNRYHTISQESVNFGVPVHLSNYVANFARLKHEPVSRAAEFITVHMVIGDFVLDRVLLDSGAYHNIVPSEIFYGLGLSRLEPYEENILLADGSVSRPPLGIARELKCRIADFIYELDFLLCDIPLRHSRSGVNRVVLGTPFFAASRAAFDFGTDMVMLHCVSSNILFKSGSFPGGGCSFGRNHPSFGHARHSCEY